MRESLIGLATFFVVWMGVYHAGVWSYTIYSVTPLNETVLLLFLIITSILGIISAGLTLDYINYKEGN